MGQKDHASVQLHGAGGVFLQLSGSAERRPAGGLQTLPGHLSEADVCNEGDLCRDRGGGGCQVLLPFDLQTTGNLTPVSSIIIIFFFLNNKNEPN